MKGVLTNIEQETKANKKFRKIMYTGAHLQLVKMSLKPGEDIGDEVHKDTDQFLRVEAGSGTIKIDGVEHSFNSGDAALIPAGTEHNVTNTGKEDLKLYTLYGPPHHKDGLVQDTKSDPDEEFDGVTTESRVSKKGVLKKVLKG